MAGNLAAATCRFLDLIGEYDASGGWAAWDMRSCAEWLSWRCQIAPGTAREHVRVARALRTLPVTHGELAAGRMGYSKVREITRIASPATEAGLVEIMTPMTAGQAERFARAHRSCTQDQPGGSREPRTSLKFRSERPASAWTCTSPSGSPCTTAAPPRTATTTTATTTTARPHNQPPRHRPN
jgi:hypothetical protein